MKTINIKTLMSALAAVAVSAASAGAFTWTIDPAEGKKVTTVEIFTLASTAKPRDPSQLACIRGSDWVEGFDEKWENTTTATVDQGFRWENGVLQAKSVGWDGMTKDSWYDVYQLKFRYNTDTKSDHFLDWSEVLNKVNSSGKFTTTTDYGTLTISNLPEPTSGLMLLLGAGMLALRRKQVLA